MNLYDLIKKHEGVRYSMYEDSPGLKTIGIGHNPEDGKLSEAAVEQIFQDDLYIVVAEIHRNFSWFDSMDNVRQAVVIDMVFNMGISRFKGFKQTIRMLSKRQYGIASVEMLDSLWASQVGNRADTLSRMMLTGEWS